MTSDLSNYHREYLPYGSYSLFQFERSDVISVLKNSIEYSFVFFKCLLDNIYKNKPGINYYHSNATLLKCRVPWVPKVFINWSGVIRPSCILGFRSNIISVINLIRLKGIICRKF